MATSENKDVAEVDESPDTLRSNQDGPSLARFSRNGDTSRQTMSRSISPRLTRSATTPAPSTQQPLRSSPLPSREGSPNRTLQTAAKFGPTRAVRSRKNSTEHSPQRAASSLQTSQQGTPSAAAVQRALSTVGGHRLPSSATTQSFEGQDPSKASRATSLSSSQDRLRSPSSNIRNAPATSKSSEQASPPFIIVNSAAQKPFPSIKTIREEDASEDDVGYSSRAPKPGSAFLETVQEDGPPSASTDPGAAAKAPARPSTIQEDPDEDNPDMVSSQTTSETKSSGNNADSGSGSEGVSGRKDKARDKEKDKEKEKEKDGGRATDQSRPAPSLAAVTRRSSVTQLTPGKTALQPRRSFQHLTPARTKVQSEGSVKGMTVETETVSNPDLLADDREGRNVSGRLDGTGSVRAKASTETIRPRNDRRKVRKPANIGSGTGSSKADIFEAKVASAVDEAANSSDSEETFVYESNPPEPRSSQRNQQGPRYHHSRTPSAASMKSQTADARSRSQHFGIAGKKSMKFTNPQQLRDADDEDGASTYSSTTARSSHRHHHHIARLGRLQNASQESDPPVSSSAKSPRVRQYHTWRGGHGTQLPQEQEQLLSSLADKQGSSNLYDLSGTAEADDEYTPLLVPNGRGLRHDARRRTHRPSRTEPDRVTPLRTCLRVIKYLFMTIVILLALTIVVTGMVLCSRQLQDVHVKEIRNVLASEQELFLELEVHALNPNLVDISISECELDLFAKSKYVGTTEMWRDGTIPGIEKPRESRNSTTADAQGGVDEGTDPIEEPGAGTHTMLLGRVRQLDSPLIFESSPLGGPYKKSTAGLHLVRPGNKTEEGGSRRWENVMQHPFELHVRGKFRYTLPLSSKPIPAAARANTTVKPDKPTDGEEGGDGGNKEGGGRNETVGIGIIKIRRRTAFQA